MKITDDFSLPDSEMSLSATRSQGSGGQNVNKVSTAIHLRFDVRASSLPEEVKTKLLKRSDRRITREGVVVIKAQRHRTQEKNRKEARGRLAAIIAAAMKSERRRKRTRPTGASRARRLDSKTKRGRLKNLRKPVDY